MICKITNFLRIFFNQKKFVKFEFSIYGVGLTDNQGSVAQGPEHGSDLGWSPKTNNDVQYMKTKL